jgi:serine protease DegS
MSAQLAVAVAVVAALSGCRRARVHVQNRAPALGPAAPAVPPPSTPPANTQLALPGGRSIADIAAVVTPSVVNVFSERQLRQPLVADPFGALFGAPHPRHALSLGSGVIVGKDGVIVTNHHVIAQAETIRVSLKNGQVLVAKLVGSDPKSDVAVLRVDAHDLPAIQIADASKIRVGDLVLAIGNPFGIGQTVTMGIISATGRANLGITAVEDFIQTDAAINPGNSGGALVDMSGRLVGLNTAIVSGSGGYQGIGFAIPSTIVVEVANQILSRGKVERGYLGIALADLPPPRAGVLVAGVATDSPGARAGLRRGDIITAINRVATPDAAHARNAIDLAGPTHVVVDVTRSGRPLVLDAALTAPPSEP